MLNSAIYTGVVAHERVRPKHHNLQYTVFSFLLDLDELEELDRQSRLFGYNRRALFSFYDKDHGTTTGAPLRPWVENELRHAGIDTDGGPIRLLCYPRILGYVFNPLSVYFVYRRTGGLSAILYEVCNTFHERHTYVIPVTDPSERVVSQQCGKQLYVSPFMPMETRYGFKIVPPAETLNIAIRQEDDQGLLLTASFCGDYAPLTTSGIRKCLYRFPLMTAKIIAAIHWEALKLLIKGVPLIRHRPALKAVDSTAVSATEAGR